jgi:hypothetical protein
MPRKVNVLVWASLGVMTQIEGRITQVCFKGMNSLHILNVCAGNPRAFLLIGLIYTCDIVRYLDSQKHRISMSFFESK